MFSVRNNTIIAIKKYFILYYTHSSCFVKKKKSLTTSPIGKDMKQQELSYITRGEDKIILEKRFSSFY